MLFRSQMRDGEIYGLQIQGRWHDTGNKEKYLEAILDVALSDPSLAPAVLDYIKSYQGKSE